MFERIANNRITFDRRPIEVLNKPAGWEIFDGQQELSISRIKIASIDKSQDLGGFDLTQALKEHPDHLFVKVFAIKKDEVNDNGDAFSEGELKKAAHTFIGVPVFCNHANDDIEKARGKVCHAWYDDDRGGIYIISMVDKTAYPKLARGIEEGYIGGTSMGCQVHHSLCSICHNYAHVAEEYCDHVRHRKTKKFSGKVKCAYHESKNKPTDDCPECGCKKGDPKSHDHREAQIYEHNYGLKFIEDSFVVNPACHDCLVDCVLNVPEFSKKVAEVGATWRKFAGSYGEDRLIKIAGQQELEYLNQAMRMMEVVAKSMMDQKEQVSMEYVSDIVKVLASLQTATDELVEMGYAQLASPPTLENPDLVGDASPLNPETTAQQQPAQQQQAPAAAPQPAPGGATSQPAGGIGSVTKPSFSPSASGKMKELLKEGEKLREAISSIRMELTQASQIKEPAIMADKNEKTAAGEGASLEQHQVTTQKQLEEFSKKDVLHGRTETAPDGVTESDQQLGLKTEPVNDTTSQSGQVRQNKFPDEVTQGQLERPVFGEGFIERWNSYPDVVTEKTWRDFDRAVGAILSTDQKEHTTQAQLEDLRSNHTWTEPNFTTENQLKSDKNWATKDNAWLDKAAAADYSKRLVTAAIEALADAIVVYKRTPSELVKAAQFITKDPANHMKAAFITLVNGIPTKKSARAEEAKRNRYFDKLASQGSATDFLLACMGDHCMNLKAEELVDAVRFVAMDSKKMAAVEERAKVKAASSETVETNEVVDKFAAFSDAFNDITNADGMYEVRCAASEIGLALDKSGRPSDPAAFVAAAEKFARTQVASTDVVLYSVEFDPETSVVHTQLKEASKLTTEEKSALQKQASTSTRTGDRDQMVKSAQMMGGQMGGQGGAGQAPGAGASLPTPPGGSQDQGAPPMESMEAPEGEEGGMPGEDGEPKPPGTICPVCASDDVDILEGNHKCNNCGTKYRTETNIVILENGYDKKNQGGEGGAGEMGDEGGEGFPMPGEETGAGGEAAENTPNIPIAASVKITPNVLKKLAEKEIVLGSISPYTGSVNTHVLETRASAKFVETDWLDMSNGLSYSVKIANKTDDAGNTWGRWEFSSTPRTGSKVCTSCRRARSAWTKALKSQGIATDDFNTMSFKKRADAVLEMYAKGLFQMVKTASANASVVGEFKKAYTVNGKFPTESCREKLARRYGQEALAISGPCKGERIYDCVCNQLKNANVYSDRLALKIADAWKDKDACVECMEDHVRLGFDLDKSATVCQHLKVKFASDEELFAEDLGDTSPMGGDSAGDLGGDIGVGDDDFGGDPFAADDGMDGGDLSGDSGDDLGGDIGGDLGAGDEGGLPGAEVPPGEVEMKGDNLDINAPAGAVGLPGGGEQTVTIEIPVDAIKQLVIDKLGPGSAIGDLGKGPSDVPMAADGAGLGDIPQIAEEAVESLGGEHGEGGEEGEAAEVDGEPGEESHVDGGESEKEEGHSFNPFEKDESENKEPEVDDHSTFEGGGEEAEHKEAKHLADIMRKGKRVGQIDLDLASVQALLKKQAINEGQTPTVEPAQDVAKDYQNGKTMGHEQKFDPSKPSVPRGQATIGAEASDLNPKDKPLPKVPAGGGEMGHEKELGYTNDKLDMTGGKGGAGKTPTAGKQGPAKVAQQAKTAGEKKIAPKEPVGDSVPFEFSANKDHVNTPDILKRTPFAESDKKEISSIPEKGEGAFMGDEKTSIEFVPKAPEDQPEIPAGGGRDKKYDRNEKYAPELQEKIKGTVIANDEKSQEVKKEAYRIAARMLEAKMIEAVELMEKVAQLQRYDLNDLSMLERSIFKSASKAKGLATAPDGIEGSPVVISAASNERSSQGDLTKALQGLFKLDRQNKIASELTDDDLRNTGDPQRRAK